MPTDWRIEEYEDCPRYSIYTYQDGRIVCHPLDLRLAERVLVEQREAEEDDDDQAR